MGITISEAIENNLISSECSDILPKKCKCGSDLEINESLKWLECTSKSCSYSVITGIEKIFNMLDIHISEDDIIKIVNKLNIISPYQILILNRGVEKHISNISIDYDKLSEFRNTPHYLYEIVELCGDESIEKIAKTLFFGFNSFDEAYREIETSQVSFIDERLGIINADSMALSYNIYNKLVNLKEQFIFIESELNIRKHENKLNIAFSDNVLPFMNKSDVIIYLNTKYNYTFCMVTSINETTDILIRNADGNSNKNRIASTINNNYVADLMNNDKITLSEINQLHDDKLKPLGCVIYITNINSLIEHLDKLEVDISNE